MRVFATILLAAATATLLPAAKNLEIYFIDVEGGQATLFVAPSGESLLVDTGWPGNNSRDANRIAAAAKHAGVKAINYLLITHFHMDHVGGVQQLIGKLPVRTYIDHGESVEHDQQAKELYAAYIDARAKGQHILAKPGVTIPIKGLDVQVLTADGDEIPQPLPGAGQPNPLCSTTQLRAPDASENARSVGTLITFNKFRILDLGDLTWNKERELVCPNNKIGPIDLYVVSHHGSEQSGSPVLVDAIHPRVAIMDNGARKGGSAEAWQTIHASPGLEDIWQLHFAVAGGKDNNTPDTFIANIDEQGDPGNWLAVSVHPDGGFEVHNPRNKYVKNYPPKS